MTYVHLPTGELIDPKQLVRYRVRARTHEPASKCKKRRKPARWLSHLVWAVVCTLLASVLLVLTAYYR